MRCRSPFSTAATRRRPPACGGASSSSPPRSAVRPGPISSSRCCRTSDPNAQAFAIVVMLLVSTVMSLLAAAIPAAFVAGMLPMIVGVILLYAPRLHGAALPTAALSIGVIGYFLVVARRLHAALAAECFVPGGKRLADRRARTGQAQFGRGAPPRRERQSGQVALSGDDEPRAAHAAQRGPRLLRSDEGRTVRSARGAGL